MLRQLKLLFVLSVLFITASCSQIYGEQGVIKGRDSEYLQAKSIPPLKLPPGSSASAVEEHYPVSAKDFPESSKRVSLIPPEL